MSKYTPAGYSIRPITTLNGEPLRYGQSLEALLAMLPAAKLEYGDSTTIRAELSENGNLNRDGDYSCSYSTTHHIVASQPYYSYEDNKQIMRENLEAVLARIAESRGIKLGSNLFKGSV